MSDIIRNPRPQEFKWAQDRGANLREPIAALKNKGWQYADVPTASNFNWLINELSKWDNYLDERINSVSNDIDALSISIDKYNEELRKDLRIVVSILSALIERVTTHHPHPPFLRQRLPTFEDP